MRLDPACRVPGRLLTHLNHLIRLVTEPIQAGSTQSLDLPDIGGEGTWNLDAIMEARQQLAARFFEVFDALDEPALMERRPDAYPPRWAEWPLLMRMLRPILDIATHIGQVNYARRQLGNPVGQR